MSHHSALLIGQRIGTYRIVSFLGAGGMGEVYRARDEKLERDVAIKVLPSSFTSDPDRLARFEREARVLATLNHASIAAIYGHTEADGVCGLILELVEGPTLAERISSGPMTVNETLTIGQEIAEALEAAHEKGIIHRDLKPANIKLTSVGRVKVLDFGVATTFQEGAVADDSSQAPTLAPAHTHTGVILGTAPYMSPEQARGQRVDNRTDIWAFGCVLYEMLAGRVPFGGDTTSDVIAAILEREPNCDALSQKTPPRVRQLLGRCLVNDRRHRLRDIGDARLELREALTTPDSTKATASVAPRRFSRPVVALLIGALMIATGVRVGISWLANSGSGATAARLSDGARASSNAEANAYYERALLFGGIGTSNPQQAQRMIERALALDPRFAAARAEYAFFNVVSILNGRSNDVSLFYKAESEIRQALSDDPRCAYAGMQIFGPASAADFYAVMSDADKALEWLDRAARMGDHREEYLRRNPLLTNLRAHPRFQQILDAVAYRRQPRPVR